ncbi:DUF4097 family beta strand repeat-containing protein [Jeotgalicoccus sp. S0W5]|uniref:DUF4097 family beta strand repeat-containing protein n=1 Tax=Jeotgalicoccus sp. S0W5 TaxID=2527874 RepID=UPI0014151052|nr:DUF4097 family beta strand repeat-containing protein [Jeotgalicoccus sp. S0W5]
MESKERILKMLEEGKISSSEAIELMSALNDKKEKSKQQQQETSEEQSDSDKGVFNDYINQFVDEFNKYVNKDKVTDTYSNVKNKFGNQRQTKQVFDGLEKAFDSVGSSFDTLFSKGPKNRLIETIDEEFSSISLDIANGNIELKPAENTNVVKFEVTPFYRKLDTKKNYFQDIICDVRNGELVIVSDVKSARVNVVVEVTQDVLKRIILAASNGSVSIQDKEFQDATIDILNGDIDLSNVEAKSAFLRTSRGNVKVREGDYQNIEVISMLGTIMTDNLNAKAIEISSNGSVNLALKNSTEEATINSNMGSINISVPQGKPLEGRLSTVLGQINYPPEVDARFMKHQDIGFKELMLVNDSDEEGLFLEVGTKVGSVTLHRS